MTVQGRLPAAEVTVLTDELIGDLAPVRIQHPAGTFALTPASAVSLRAIDAHRDLLSGIGIDWGCGTGCLAIVAARLAGVRRMMGLDISEPDIRTAQVNARENAVDHKVRFIVADSFRPLTEAEGDLLRELRGRVDFVLANPPASPGDDGFAFRRQILAGARPLLRPGGRVLLQISTQYGLERIAQLGRAVPGVRPEGVLVSTPWVPFDLARDDLSRQLEAYALEEERGGLPYWFGDPRDEGRRTVTARAALARARKTGVHPLTRWQVHGFRLQTVEAE